MKIKSRERQAVSGSLGANPATNGNDRSRSLAQALQEVEKVLQEFGFTMGMVSMDEFIGDKGFRTLPYSRTYRESEADSLVENSRVCISWEKTSDDPLRIEVVAYLS